MKKLATDNKELVKGRPFTYLTAEAASGTASITVENIVDFAVNQVLQIGETEDEISEIIKTHTSTAPATTTITLASNLAKTHAPYTKVYILLYDQVEFSHADMETGDKTIITTKTITPDRPETSYDDTTYSTGYYFSKFKNSINGNESGYTDAIPFAGLAKNTVGFAINWALKRNKMAGFTENIDYQFCIDDVNSCLQFITGKLKGWSKLLKTNYVAGQTTRGIHKIALPSDIWENRGMKSILGVRIGTATDLTPKTMPEMEKEMEGVIVTQVRTQAAAGSTTLAIDNSYDFADSGSVSIFISGTLYTITYTGVTRSATAGVLTGVPASGTGAITVTIPVDTYIWKGEAEGEPEKFSVDGDGNLVFWPFCDASYDNLNVYMDYWTGPTSVDSDADTLDTFRYDAVKHWLTWAIRMQLKNDGKRDLTDGDYIQFSQILADYIRAEVPAHRKKKYPRINSITY
jgi:hypothetical protein